MDFSSLVLMEIEKDTNLFLRELGSYEVGEGAKFVKKLYCIDNEVFIYFDTNKDVEEWEYTAIFDCFNLELFEEKGMGIEEVDDEYNPTWKLKTSYMEQHMEMKEKLNRICSLISEEMDRVFEEVKNKKEEYM